MSYCTVEELRSLIGIRENDFDATNNASIERFASDRGDELTGVYKNFGYNNSKKHDEDQIKERLLTGQARLMAMMNALLSFIDFIKQRAPEIDDVRLIAIARKQAEFLASPFNLFSIGTLFTAWQPSNKSYPIPTARPSSRAITFTGSGLNNLSVSGIYSGLESAEFTFELTYPNAFKWKKGDGEYSAPITITGSNQAISDGISIKIAPGTHHTADQWKLIITVWASSVSLSQKAAGWTKDSNDPPLDLANLFLDWFTVYVYTIAANRYRINVDSFSRSKARRLGEIITDCAACLVQSYRALESNKNNLDVPTYELMLSTLKSIENLQTDLWDGILI